MRRILRKPGLFGRSLKSARPDVARGRVAFSCVIDSDPKFVYQTARLLLSLRWFGGQLSNAPFYLNSTAELSDSAARFFIRHDARVIRCEAFDSEQPHITSNKLRGLEIDELKTYETVVLVDADTLIVGDPSRYCGIEGIALKIADLPTVKDDLLRLVFKELNLDVPKRIFSYELSNDQTFGYFNSGVVIVAGDWLDRVSRSWTHNCRRLLVLEQPLGIPKHFIEQSALAATIVELNIPLDVLPASMNLPVHFQAGQYPDWYHGIDPQVIHYHWLSDEGGFIQKLPLSTANLKAEMFNARLRAEIRTARSAVGAISARRKVSPPVASRNGPKIVVGSGWWCDRKPHDWALGADITRSTAFFQLWLRQVQRYLNPDRIVITDSHSPLKPDWQSHPGIHWIELDRNYGGPNDVRVGKVKTKFSGFTKSVINGAMYALCCDADFYVYVEQDCLIRGEDFLDHAIGDSDAQIFLGQRTQGGQGIEGRPAAPMIQQSCIVVRKSGMERFIAGIMAGPETDGDLSPEIKMDRDLKPYDFLRVPFGRSRPIDFSLDHFYAQHLQAEELNRFLASEELDEGFLEPSESLILNL